MMLYSTSLKASVQSSGSAHGSTFHAPPLATLICLADLHRCVPLNLSRVILQKRGVKG